MTLPALASLVLALSALPGSALASRCDLVSSPSGDDRAAGTPAAPFASPHRLVRALRPGQTGCFRRGRYAEDVTLRKPRVTLANWPGERAVLRGRLRVMRTADGVTVRGLHLDGRNRNGLPSPIVLADDVVFSGNDITNHRTNICFIVGAVGWEHSATARRTVISGNRIHDCGVRPATNLQHAVYLQHVTDARVVDNVIYDNADRAVQLYVSAHRTLIAGNIIDGNGEGIIFSGGDGLTSSDNRVVGNVISFPRVRAAVESWYPPGAQPGRDNVVTGNCVFGRRTIEPGPGFVAQGNVIANPGYRDRAHHDYRLPPGGRCAAALGSAAPPAAPDALTPPHWR